MIKAFGWCVLIRAALDPRDASSTFPRPLAHHRRRRTLSLSSKTLFPVEFSRGALRTFFRRRACVCRRADLSRACTPPRNQKKTKASTRTTPPLKTPYSSDPVFYSPLQDPQKRTFDARDTSRFVSRVCDKKNQNSTQETNRQPSFEHTGVRKTCLLYTSPSPRDATLSRMPSSA